jgi:hypothetical protein
MTWIQPAAWESATASLKRRRHHTHPSVHAYDPVGWLAGSPRQQCICSQQTDALSILNSNSMRFRFKNPVHAVTPLFKYANWMLFTAIYFLFLKKK